MPTSKPRKDLGQTWGELSDGMKSYYRNKGVTPGPFNKWGKMSQLDRTALTIEAKKAGYDSGLQFLATQAQVRRRAPKKKTITVKTKPSDAAQQMIRGAKGPEADESRKIVAKLFNFDEFDRVEWENFLSP